MPTKNKPKVYSKPSKQSKRDIVDVLIDKCPGDIHGVHPCERCNYCVARKQIVYFREEKENR